MKKSDLVAGKHVLELKKGERFLWTGREGRECIGHHSYCSHIKSNLESFVKVYETSGYILCNIFDDNKLKLVWERRDYLTLKEVLLNKPYDKCIKHKDCPISGNKSLSVDNIIQTYMAWLCREGMSTIDASVKALDQINEKVWEYVD